MDKQQVPMFKEWFIDTFPECKEYLDLTYFDVEKNTFLSKCSYNPDSVNAAKVLRIAFGSWQHQQAKVEELRNYLYSIHEWIDENKFEPIETWLTCSVLDVDEFLDVFCIGELSKKPKYCNHESNGVAMLSNPPVFKCRKCGENYKKQALKGEG